MISSREYSWYNKIRAGDWWNRTQAVKKNVSSYYIIMIINQKSDVKLDESKYSNTSGLDPIYRFMR